MTRTIDNYHNKRITARTQNELMEPLNDCVTASHDSITQSTDHIEPYHGTITFNCDHIMTGLNHFASCHYTIQRTHNKLKTIRESSTKRLS